MANVLVVHKLTGEICSVPEEHLEIFPDVLTKATEKQLKAAKDKEETRIYGAPLKNGVIPGDLAYVEGAGVEAVGNTIPEGSKTNG